MTTSALVPSPSASALNTAPAASTSNPLGSLNTSDFIKMMITQLQNQDPLQPESNDELMSQMNQIGQLQSNTMLQTTLQGLALQTQIGSASSLMGKMVQGTDANNNAVQGIVTSVQVQSGGVNLGLDNGKSLGLSQVTSITAAPGSTAPTTPA